MLIGEITWEPVLTAGAIVSAAGIIYGAVARFTNKDRDLQECRKDLEEMKDGARERMDAIDEHLKATDAHQVEQDIRISKIETERRVEAEFSLKRASALAREREKGLLRKRDDQ